MPLGTGLGLSLHKSGLNRRKSRVSIPSAVQPIPMWLSSGVVHLGSAVGIAPALNRAIADVLVLYEAGSPAVLETKTMESSGAT